MGTELYILSNGQAAKMIEKKYETEIDLQKLIADNPQLLTEQEDEQLILINREMQVMKSEDSSDSYSLDHLFVNQDGLPILVEVKRSSDTRIRREVIAQMLDYASRAANWSVQYLRQCFCENNDDETIQAYDTDEFWQQVATNIKAERMRLIFAADEIPATLKIIIDFLNRNLKNIEVCGAEIRQYQSDSNSLISSSIICGNTLKQAAISSRNIEWTADTFARQLLTLSNPPNNQLTQVVENIRLFSESIGLNCTFGHGSKYATYTARFKNVHIFKVSNWIYKDNVFKCTIEFPIFDFANLFDDANWNEQEIRNLLTNFPNKSEAYAKKLIWDSQQNLYIDLNQLTDEKNIQLFEQALKQLCKMIEVSTSQD